MNLICNKIRLQYNELKEPEIILTSSGYIKPEIEELKGIIAKGKQLLVVIKQFRHKRSLDANAYMWVLLGEIASALRTTKDELYLLMLERYGIYTHVIVKPEAVSKVKQEWRTVRELGEVKINGNVGQQLQCYFGSSTYNSKEFSTLLNGVVEEAKEMGIDVISNREIKSLLEAWGK